MFTLMCRRLHLMGAGFRIEKQGRERCFPFVFPTLRDLHDLHGEWTAEFRCEL